MYTVDTPIEPTTSTLDPMLPATYQIERVIRESYDTFTLEMTPTAEYEVSPFEAGQFNMLYVFGVGEIPISISGDPKHPKFWSIRRAPSAPSPMP
jgi:NAD(P)H-flavin reductase